MTDLYARVEGKVGNITFNFEHSFKSKGITVLYGPNGAGKSTISLALTRIIEIDKGAIMIDGYAISDFSLKQLR